MSRFQAVHDKAKKGINPQVLKDMHPNWLSVARRMESVSKSRGAQLITITVVVDKDGVPQLWLNPVTRQVEPSASAEFFLKSLLGMDGKTSLIDSL